MKCCDFDHFDDQDALERECLNILSKAEARRAQGAKEYGHDNFFHKDVFDDIEEELIDTINYCVFQIIKIRQTKKKLQDATGEAKVKIEMMDRTGKVLAKFTQDKPGAKIKFR